MFRKLTIIICLISFVPATVGAQGLVTPAPSASPAAVETENAALPSQAANLLLTAERSEKILLATADTSQNTCKCDASEQVKASNSDFEWGNFAEVHLGGYRWVWWAGAAAALIAIHAGH
jgi:hypothetical protein